MSEPSFAPARESDRANVIATLVSAFIGDPVERWLFPEPLRYLTHFPRFVAAFGGEAFGTGTVWTRDDFAAVAVWIAPESEPDADGIVRALTEGVAVDKHADMLAVLEQMDELHPRYPHWYLPWLGVDHAHQGHGLGAELLEQCLGRIDADGVPAYLETPNPRAIPLYRRHGFTVTGVARAGDCPPVKSMLRAPR